MGIKRYIIFSIIYLAAISVYVYSLSGESYALNIATLSLDLPIAAWIIIPAAILFIASSLHMMVYGFKDFLSQRSLKKDFETFKNVLARKILSEDLEATYKTSWFQFLGNSLKILHYKMPTQATTLNDEQIDSLMQIVQDIDEGKVVELKKYKLSAENQLKEKVARNKLTQDPKYASVILKECQDETSELCHDAYFAFLRYASFDEIKKIHFAPTKEMFRVLMERYLDPEDKFDMPLESIEELLMQFKATREDYLELAYEIKVKLSPDAWMALFEKLYNSPDHTEVSDAYLFVLYELQMIDKIREILENSEEGEFVKFKTLLFLKDHGKNVNSGIFLRFA
ncbi:MAG: fatty-acid--CoA ligase [Sulfurospirillum sp.]|nr:fatty-acid--CoA ligase [Sulfurospirillum sp.]